MFHPIFVLSAFVHLFALNRQASYRLPLAIDRPMDVIHPKLFRLTYHENKRKERENKEQGEVKEEWEETDYAARVMRKSPRSGHCKSFKLSCMAHRDHHSERFR